MAILPRTALLFSSGPSQPVTIPRPRTAAPAELLSRQIDALLTCPDLTDTTRLAAVNAVTRAADPTPCPHWCAECVSPDPGVIVHYSKPWEGVDQFDGATWQVTVTQRIAEGVADLAVVDVIGDGTFGSLTAFTEALSAAQRLADDINGGAR